MSSEPNPTPKRPMVQWHARTYEFATVEAALLYVAVVAALALASGGWPSVELRGTRVRVRPADSGIPEPGASPMPAWSGWADRLGGSEVIEEPKPKEPENRDRE